MRRSSRTISSMEQKPAVLSQSDRQEYEAVLVRTCLQTALFRRALVANLREAAVNIMMTVVIYRKVCRLSMLCSAAQPRSCCSLHRIFRLAVVNSGREMRTRICFPFGKGFREQLRVCSRRIVTKDSPDLIKLKFVSAVGTYCLPLKFLKPDFPCGDELTVAHKLNLSSERLQILKTRRTSSSLSDRMPVRTTNSLLLLFLCSSSRLDIEQSSSSSTSEANELPICELRG